MIGFLAIAAMPRVEAKLVENVPFKQPVTVPTFQGLIASWAGHHRRLIVAIATSQASANGPSLSPQRAPLHPTKAGPFRTSLFADPENGFDAAGIAASVLGLEGFRCASVGSVLMTKK